MNDIVVGSLQKRGIDRCHRLHALRRQSRAKGQRVFFRDSYVEKSFAVLFFEGRKSRSVTHSRSDRTYLFIAVRQTRQLFAKHGRKAFRSRPSAFGINRVVLAGIPFSGLVSKSLFGFQVNDNALRLHFRISEYSLYLLVIVSVNRPHVEKSQILKIIASVKSVFESLFRSSYQAEESLSHKRDPEQEATGKLLCFSISHGRAQF